MRTMNYGKMSIAYDMYIERFESLKDDLENFLNKTEGQGEGAKALKANMQEWLMKLMDAEPEEN